MFRILSFILIATCLLNCARTEEDGVDVKASFLKTMAGTYSSEPVVPNAEGLPNDELTITLEGTFSMTQYWYLDYPHETCVLASDDIDCSVEMKTTYCRVTDSGRIDRVFDLEVKKDDKDTSLQSVTHIIEGMRTSSQLDDGNTYGTTPPVTEDEEPGDDTADGRAPEVITPSSVLACREMVLRKNQLAGSQLSRYKVNWANENTLKFQHKTAPEKSGVGSLEVSGTFTRE